MFEWFKKLKEIVVCHKQLMKIIGSYDRDHKWFMSRIVQAENLIKDRTDVSTDVHLTNHDLNQIIVTGRYRNTDYVEAFTLPDNELKTLIEQLREMQRYGTVSRIDAPYQVRKVIKRELERY